MMLGERIKKIRKGFGLTQAEFAKQIGIASNTVSQIENGSRNPGGAVIKVICQQFGINESWLCDGEGEMLPDSRKDADIATFFADVLKDNPESFRRRFVSMLAKLDAHDWEELTRIARKMAKGEDV